MPSNLSRSDLTLEHITYEIRYPSAYMIWDKSGAIANEIRKNWPEIENVEAIPARVKYRLGRTYEISVELEKTFIGAQLPPSNLKDFGTMAAELTTIVQQFLEISDFTRVGLRLIYNKDYESATLATQALLSTSVIELNCPREKFFGQEGQPSASDFRIRWENDKTGILVQLRSETTRIDFNPPLIFKDISPIKKDSHKFVFDVDYYTIAKVSASQLRPIDWIDNVMHLFNRDSKHFLGG